MDFGLGLIPDLLRGKKFDEALGTNLKQGALAGLAMFGIPALAGGAATGAATGSAIDYGTGEAFANVAGAGASGGSAAVTPSAGFGGLLGSAGQALGAANSAQGLLSGPQQAAPQVSNQTDGGAGLSQLYASMRQGDAQRMQEEMQKRQKMNGLFGGQNGWTA
jgi:hypothetical protein